PYSRQTPPAQGSPCRRCRQRVIGLKSGHVSAQRQNQSAKPGCRKVPAPEPDHQIAAQSGQPLMNNQENSQSPIVFDSGKYPVGWIKNARYRQGNLRHSTVAVGIPQGQAVVCQSLADKAAERFVVIGEVG